MGENIAHQLLKLSVWDLSSEDMLNLADALTRTGVIQVHQRKDLAAGRHFLHQSFQIYEHLLVPYPHLRTTPYYEFMMWHRCFLDPDPTLINLAYEWVRTVPQSNISTYHFSDDFFRVLPWTLHRSCGSPRKASFSRGFPKEVSPWIMQRSWGSSWDLTEQWKCCSSQWNAHTIGHRSSE